MCNKSGNSSAIFNVKKHKNMNLNYRTTTVGPDKLRTLHVVVVGDEILTTTRAKEILQFVKNRNPTRYEWKQIKQAVDRGEAITITDGY